MLHCDMELYEEILKANWDRDRIRNLVLIGNSLTDYLDRCAAPIPSASAPSSLILDLSLACPALESRSALLIYISPGSNHSHCVILETALRSPVG